MFVRQKKHHAASAVFRHGDDVSQLPSASSMWDVIKDKTDERRARRNSKTTVADFGRFH